MLGGEAEPEGMFDDYGQEDYGDYGDEEPYYMGGKKERKMSQL